MEKKINIAELLKDCPKGMELDCTMLDNVVFEKIDRSSHHPIILRRTDLTKTIHLTKYGQYSDEEDYKCVIFPKGKTTWEGFVPPYQFKDGDIVSTNDGYYIFILKGEIIEKGDFYKGKVYFGYRTGTNQTIKSNMSWYFSRLATEEEKQRLFNAIKDNGYKWNAETKTLEKLVEPKFKVGDRVIKKDGISVPILITNVGDEFYYTNTEESVGFFSIQEQDNWVLVPNKFDITTLKPFESRVLVRHNKDDKWCCSFFSHINDSLHSYCYKFVTTSDKAYPYCIPYVGNEHLLGTINDCDEFFKTWE